MKKVLLADDHPIFRAGLRSIIEAFGSYNIVAEVGDGESCITQVELLNPDFLLLDLAIPRLSGFEVAERLLQSRPDVRIIIVSMHSEREFVERAMEIGISGFVAKEDAGTELLNALEALPSEFFLSSSSGKANPIILRDTEHKLIEEKLDRLSVAELLILKLVASAKTSKLIARELGLSYRTVQTHRQNIANKLDIHGNNALIQFAIQNRTAISER